MVIYRLSQWFLLNTALDSSGRPWGSILAGPDDEPRFRLSPKYMSLSFNVKLWDGDPYVRNTMEFGHD